MIGYNVAFCVLPQHIAFWSIEKYDSYQEAGAEKDLTSIEALGGLMCVVD